MKQAYLNIWHGKGYCWITWHVLLFYVSLKLFSRITLQQVFSVLISLNESMFIKILTGGLSFKLGCLNCMKSVQIRGFSRSVFSCIQSEYRKIWTRKNSVLGHFSRTASGKKTDANGKGKRKSILWVINSVRFPCAVIIQV